MNLMKKLETPSIDNILIITHQFIWNKKSKYLLYSLKIQKINKNI